MLEEAGLEDEVEIEVSAEGIRIRATRTPRAGWAAAAAELAERREDTLLDRVTTTAFDEAEWEW
jgi:antitoxin component of MazEF toxin-antitoxin module